jgi:hypothetical protein
MNLIFENAGSASNWDMVLQAHYLAGKPEVLSWERQDRAAIHGLHCRLTTGSPSLSAARDSTVAHHALSNGCDLPEM